MSVPTVTHVICPACSATLDVEDHYCRRCGMPTSLRRASGGPLASDLRARRDPLDSPWVVLGLLLFVLGPFALPFLYRSRAFGLPMKIVLTVVVCAIAAFAVWITLYLIGQIAAPVKELWHELNLLPLCSVKAKISRWVAGAGLSLSEGSPGVSLVPRSNPGHPKIKP